MGSRSPVWLTPLVVVVLGTLATAGAIARGSKPAAPEPPASTSPHVGEPLGASNQEQRALSDHLRSRGAVFYGAWWCPACFQQKNLFGKEAGNRLPYVECDKSDEGRQRCMAAKVRAFPTWELKGKPRLEGVQDLEALKQWSEFPGAEQASRP
jgi:hypothetical protein